MWTLGLKINKFFDQQRKKQNDQLVRESIKTLHINNEIITTLHFTPSQEQELVQGYCHTLGYPNVTIDSKPDTIKVTTNAPSPISGFTTFTASLNQSVSTVYQLTSQFQEKAFLFKSTAVTESAALCLNTTLLYFSEDLSKENALYKIVGQCQNDTLSNQYCWLTSAQVDLPYIQRINRLGIPTIISRTGPTDQAYQFAKNHHMVLIGFARGRRCNVYTGELT